MRTPWNTPVGRRGRGGATAAWALVMVGALVGPLSGSTSVRAAEPPSASGSYPADGARGVPTNASLWIWGMTLSSASPEVRLVRAGTETALPLTVEKYAAPGVRTMPTGGNLQGALLRRHASLLLLHPARPFAPRTTYQLTYRVFPSDSRHTVSFETGTGSDEQRPVAGVLSKARTRRVLEGRGKRNVTVIDVGPARDDRSTLLRLDLLVGQSKLPAAFALVKPGEALTVAFPRRVVAPIRARVVDLAGNASDLTPAVTPPPRKGKAKGWQGGGIPLWVFVAAGSLIGLLLLAWLIRRNARRQPHRG